MNAAKMSSKHQVVIPKETRRVLGIKAGDEVWFVPRDGVIYLLPKATSLANALAGTASGKRRFPKSYLKKERSSW